MAVKPPQIANTPVKKITAAYSSSPRGNFTKVPLVGGLVEREHVFSDASFWHVGRLVVALPLMLREFHQARKRRVRLATPAAQERDQAVQRRAFMPIKGAEVYLLHLSAAGAEGIEKREAGGDGDANHR